VRISWLCNAVCGTLLALTPAAHAAGAVRYVALGDSFVAGPLIPDPQPGSPPGCLRSTHNYPSLVAAKLKIADFADVSCSGAQTGDVTKKQLGALTPKTTLVTLGIGGNDIGYGNIAVSCGELGLFNPFGAPCAKKYGATVDRRISATAPKVGRILAAIHSRAPLAKVLVVGYLRLLPSGRGCWPRVPLGPADTAYVDAEERKLNRMLADQARAAKVTFIDTYKGGDGHDVCAAEPQRWVEGVVPQSPAAPMHPNARGMRVVAARVLAALES